jgi:hypothetical protein
MAIREGQALYLLEDVAVPEGRRLIVTIEAVPVDENSDDIPVQETLADVLGFDPEDEEKSRKLAETQQQALRELTGMFKAADDSPDNEHSVAVHHDEYIYRVDW